MNRVFMTGAISRSPPTKALVTPLVRIWMQEGMDNKQYRITIPFNRGPCLGLGSVRSVRHLDLWPARYPASRREGPAGTG